MKKLSNDWLTDGLIDFEYKKYILLAYLMEVRKNFDSTKLYPFLSDLVFHYRNLLKLKENKQLFYDSFPKRLSKADFEKLKLVYQDIVSDDDVMKEMEEIISYALPKVESTIQEGKEIHDFVEEQMEISPVGIQALYMDEGYMFLNADDTSEIDVFRYQTSVFENANEKYRGINTIFVSREEKSRYSGYEDIKLRVNRRDKTFGNPATFLVVSKLKFPIDSTLLPLAKMMLIRYISSTAI